MDLKRVFNQRGFFHYVLVIEWLENDDKRTGMMLVEHLEASGITCVYAGVETSDGFRAVIEEALARVRDWGIPAIHIETHGEKPSDNIEEDVLFGSGDGPLLTWPHLGEMLAPLNRAADFQLMLVSAACYGAAAMGAMTGATHVAPFSVCIGYETEVIDESVIDSMIELYTALLVERVPPSKAVARAEKMLRHGESIDHSTSVILAYQVFRYCVQEFNKSDPAIPPARWDIYKQRLFEAWEMWFPRELQERDETYRLDWDIVTANPTDEELAEARAARGAKSETHGNRMRSVLLKSE